LRTARQLKLAPVWTTRFLPTSSRSAFCLFQLKIYSGIVELRGRVAAVFDIEKTKAVAQFSPIYLHLNTDAVEVER
jgi:hypothetical protein